MIEPKKDFWREEVLRRDRIFSDAKPRSLILSILTVTILTFPYCLMVAGWLP